MACRVAAPLLVPERRRATHRMTENLVIFFAYAFPPVNSSFSGEVPLVLRPAFPTEIPEIVEPFGPEPVLVTSLEIEPVAGLMNNDP